MVRMRIAAWSSRTVRRPLSLVILLACAAPAWAEIPSRDCAKAKKPEDVVTACTSDLKQPAPPQNQAAALNARAKAYEALDMAKEAKADYDQAVALAPGFITWFNRGQFLLDANLFGAAAEDLGRAIALYDRTPPMNRGEMTEALYWEAHFQRGQALRRDEHYAESVADYSLVIAAQPKYDDAYTQRAFAYSHLGRLDEDIADLTTYMTLKGHDAVTLYNRGLAYVRKGDDAHAMSDFDEAIRRSPGLAALYTARGGVSERAGQRDKALADYRQAAKIDPQQAGAAAALARLQGP